METIPAEQLETVTGAKGGEVFKQLAATFLGSLGQSLGGGIAQLIAQAMSGGFSNAGGQQR